MNYSRQRDEQTTVKAFSASLFFDEGKRQSGLDGAADLRGAPGRAAQDLPSPRQHRHGALADGTHVVLQRVVGLVVGAEPVVTPGGGRFIGTMMPVPAPSGPRSASARGGSAVTVGRAELSVRNHRFARRAHPVEKFLRVRSLLGQYGDAFVDIAVGGGAADEVVLDSASALVASRK